jgi:elongation factor Tu
MNNATFIIEEIFDIKDKGLVVAGTVKGGEIRKGMWGKIHEKNVMVSEIMIAFKSISVAKEGQSCGLLLKGINKEEINRGDVIYFE